MPLKTNKLPALITTAVIIGLWWITSANGWVNAIFLPRPESVLKALIRLFTTESFQWDILLTSYRAISGLALSIIFAVPLGLLFGRAPQLYRFVELPVDFFRSIPSSSLFFMFILVFGIGDISKIAVVFYGCSLILLVNTIYGAQPTREKRDRIRMLRSFGASRRQIFNLAVFRDAIPHIAAGIRICVSLSFVLVIITEMFLSANRGIGRQIYDSYLAYRIPEMYAAILILGLVGYAANEACVVLERRVAFGTPNM